jgi:hypothetical protein
MVNWERFRAAYTQPDPRVGMLAALGRLEAWLDALVAGFEAAAADIETAWVAQQAAELLQQKLLREGPLTPGETLPAQYQALTEAVVAGRANPRERGFFLRYDHVLGLSRVLQAMYPQIVVVSPAAPVVMIGDRLEALFPRLQAALSACGIGAVTPATLAALEALCAEARALAEAASEADPSGHAAWYQVANAALGLAKGHVLLGGFAAAEMWFGKATASFERAGEPEKAAECQERLRTLTRQVAGDVDSAAEQNLRDAEIATDPIERAQALVNLSALAAQAHDLAEAETQAAAATAVLTDAKFADPEADGTEAAADGWVAEAAASSAGTPFLQKLQSVAAMWLSILGTRQAARIGHDKAGAEQADRVLREVGDLALRMAREADAAPQGISAQWAAYMPPAVIDAPEEVTLRVADRTTEERLRRGYEIDTAALAIQERLGHAGPGAEQEGLLVQARDLVAAAAAAGVMPQHIARAQYVQGQVLHQLGRPQEALSEFTAAEATLLGGRAPALHAFSTVHEREQFLQILKHMMFAHFAQKDDTGALAVCERAIGAIEPERDRVSQPNQQGAFLEDRTEFYIGAALAAFRLQAWDRLLAAMELMKARAALRNRLVAAVPDVSEADLLAAFAEVSAKLDKAARDKDAAAALEGERRRLWDRLAIARMRRAPVASLPEVSVSSLQATLAPDEAVLAWLWLSADVLLVVAIDSTRKHVERLILPPPQRRLLEAFVTLLKGLKSMHLGMDKEVAKLGAVLLPKACREFIAGKQRLILSPHRSLHLFPFHATLWDDGSFLIEHFTVRYVPNLGSLLLPWTGEGAGAVLAIGIRTFDAPGNEQRTLERAEEEVQAVRDIHAAQGAAADVLVGKGASRSALAALRMDGRLARYRCVHLATHGSSVFEGSAVEEPLESRIYLYDVVLDGIDIASLGLRAELVVMSACHSGQRALAGRGLAELPADDIFGLQATLFQSGVRSVLGALWPVDNPAAFAIQPAFHRAYAAGEPVERALQSAIRIYLADSPAKRRKVCYWAPFFITSLGRMDDGRRSNQGVTTCLA